MRWLCLLVLLAGCDRVFGSAFVADGPAATVSVRLEYRHVYNTFEGVPFATDAAPYAQSQILAVEATHAGVPVDVAADFATGTFTFEADPSARYRLVIRYASGTVAELQSRQRELRVTDIYYSRPVGLDAVQSTIGITLVGGNSAAELIVATTGIFTNTRLQPSAGTYTLEWNRSAIETAENDRIYFAQEFVTGPTEARYRVLEKIFSPASYAMSNGVSSETITLAPIDRTACTRIEAARTAEAARVAAAYPAYPTASTGWILYAVAEPLLGIDATAFLAASATPDLAHEQFDVVFGQPYPGHTVMALLLANRTRTFEHGGRQFAVSVGSRQFVAASSSSASDCARSTVLPGTRVALPTGFTLGEVALDRDDLELAIAAPELELAWTGGEADYYTVVLHELVGGTGVPSIGPGLRSYRTTEPAATIGSDVLETGHTYVFEVQARLGHPDAAEGDLTSYQYPYEMAIGMSSAFTVSR